MLAAPDQQISLTDPDSRSMATSGRGSGVVGYNVKVAVDTEHHLIITHEVTNVCKSCNIKHRCTTAKERRITRWEHEHILEAVQRRLDEHPEKMRQRRETVASLRYNQGPNGSNTLLDEDAAAGCLRDGTTRFGLQPHPRNEPHGRPAAHGSDQSIVRPEKAAGTHSRRPPKSTFLLIPERFYTAKTQSGHERLVLLRCTALTC